MAGYLWLVAAYASFTFLFAVTAYRIAVLLRMPIHLRWELSPLPGVSGLQDESAGEFHAGRNIRTSKHHSLIAGTLFMLKEVFLLKTVWQNNRRLWLFSYCMHMGLYVFVLLWAVSAGSVLLPGLLDNTVTAYLLYGAGFIGYAVCAAGSLGLILLRVVDNDLRRYSGVSTFINLALVLSVSASGVAMWFSETNPVDTLSMFIENCLSANPDMPLYGVTAVHIASLLMFTAVLPFSQMIHFAAKFFTFHRVLWDDRPTGHFHDENLAALLNQPLLWSAPHAGDGSMRSWTETIDGVKSNEEK